MSLFISAYQHRTSVETITFTSGGVEAVLGANDKVRVKIGRAGKTPLLDIVSDAPLSGGSYVTKVNPVTLEICTSDLDPAIIKPGTYDIEANVVDHNDADRIKLAEEGIFVLHPTQGGPIS